MRDLRSSEAAAVAGVSFRQLDYWSRLGLLRPKQQASGSGSQRRWAPEQVKHLRFAAVLRELGATEETLRPAIESVVDLPDRAWETRVLVTLDGRITTLLGGDANGYVVDLAHCRDTVREGLIAAA